MAGHNPRERELISDVNEKNRLANEARRIALRMRRWHERLTEQGGKRAQARYTGAIRRDGARLAELEAVLLAQAKDLGSRIQEEQKVSEGEIRQFEEQVKKEAQQLAEAQQELAAARKQLAEVDTGTADAEQAAAVMAGLHRRLRAAGREARRETQDLKDAKREVASEVRDKAFFEYELRRTVAEVEALS